MTVKELRKLCTLRKLSTLGKKDELVERLNAVGDKRAAEPANT